MDQSLPLYVILDQAEYLVVCKIVWAGSKKSRISRPVLDGLYGDNCIYVVFVGLWFAYNICKCYTCIYGVLMCICLSYIYRPISICLLYVVNSSTIYQLSYRNDII